MLAWILWIYVTSFAKILHSHTFNFITLRSHNFISKEDIALKFPYVIKVCIGQLIFSISTLQQTQKIVLICINREFSQGHIASVRSSKLKKLC